MWVVRMPVKFVDNSQAFKIVFESSFPESFLNEAGGEVVTGTQRNYDSAGRVDTGQTKNSFDYKVQDHTAFIGSSYENAIWEEFGTGEYAEAGNGRKGGWTYKKGDKYYRTKGKKGHRPFRNSYESKKAKIVKRAQDLLKEMLP